MTTPRWWRIWKSFVLFPKLKDDTQTVSAQQQRRRTIETVDSSHYFRFGQKVPKV
jgi:hypothetical protein